MKKLLACWLLSVAATFCLGLSARKQPQSVQPLPGEDAHAFYLVCDPSQKEPVHRSVSADCTTFRYRDRTARDRARHDAFAALFADSLD